MISENQWRDIARILARPQVTYMSESQYLDVFYRPGFKRKKSAFWCEGCNKDFRGSRNYNVHRERGKNCPLTASSSTGRRRRTNKSSGSIDGEEECDGDVISSVSSLDLNDAEQVDNIQYASTVGDRDEARDDADGDARSLDLNNVEAVDNIQHETTLSGSPVVDKECDEDTNTSVSSLDLHGLNDDVFEFVPEEDYYCPQTDDESSSIMDDGVDVSSSSSSENSENSIDVDGHHGDLPQTPYLEHLHHKLGGDVWDGGADACRFNSKATKECYPFANTTTAALFAFSVKWQLSRACLADLIAMLRMFYNQEGEVTEHAGDDEKKAFQS